MKTFKAEGIVVATLPYGDYDTILTLFTPEEGLIKVFCKRCYKSSGKNKLATFPSPLSIVELICSRGQGELYSCQELSIINHQTGLRKDFSVLRVACEMLRAIAATQQAEKKAEKLYELLLIYLNKLPLISIPEWMLSSFQLKILRYEGWLGPISHCCLCGKHLTDVYLHENESFCVLDTPIKNFHLTASERECVELLTFSRNFNQLNQFLLPPGLAEKISLLFEQSINSF